MGINQKNIRKLKEIQKDYVKYKSEPFGYEEDLISHKVVARTKKFLQNVKYEAHIHPSRRGSIIASFYNEDKHHMLIEIFDDTTIYLITYQSEFPHKHGHFDGNSLAIVDKVHSFMKGDIE